MPIFNWIKVNEENKIDYIKKDTKKNINKIILNVFHKEIFSQYIDRFAFTDEFIIILEKQVEILNMKLDMVRSGDLSMRTLIKVSEDELALMTSTSKSKGSLLETKAFVEKFFKFHLDIKSTTVVELYTYIDLIKKHGRNGNKE